MNNPIEKTKESLERGEFVEHAHAAIVAKDEAVCINKKHVRIPSWEELMGRTNDTKSNNRSNP